MKPESARKREKQSYRPPRLSVHGDLRRVTRAKGGSQGDAGGKPKTRSVGSPA